jgi:hypothetical protein
LSQGDFVTLPSATVAVGLGAAPAGALALFPNPKTNQVTYQVTATITAGQTISLGNFVVNNVAALGSPTTTPGAPAQNIVNLSILGSLVVGDDALPDGTNPLIPNKFPVLRSQSSAGTGTTNFFTPTTLIDITSGGKLFVAKPGLSSTTTAVIGKAQVTPNGAPLLPAATANIVLSGVSLDVSGNFSNISAAYADTANCDAATTGDKVAGTVKADSSGISFTLPAGTGGAASKSYNICIVANGTGVLFGLPGNVLTPSLTAS